MKKYNSISELLIDYRQFNSLSQLDLAALLDVDVRSVIRWEKKDTLIKADKEKDFVVALNIPYQVIRNLNTEQPIPLYFDLQKRIYSLSSLMVRADNAAWYKSDLPVEDERIRNIHEDSDAVFVNEIQHLDRNLKPVKEELIKEAARILPKLNMVLLDQSDFYAGHIVILPLKFASYQKLRDRELEEGSLSKADLSSSPTEVPRVFFFYSVYADSIPNSYFLVNRALAYFKEKKFAHYIVAGITHRQYHVTYFKEMGLQVVWEEGVSDDSEGATFLEGNLDMFLFGKML